MIELFCTSNQDKYEAILFGLKILQSMKAKHVEALVDSYLVVQQVVGVF